MSRRPDRKKHGNKEPSTAANSKDESDAMTMRSSDVVMSLQSGRSGRSEDPRTSLPYLRESPMPLQLVSESGNSDAQQPDCKSNILEMLQSLEAKINVLMQKSGHLDSSDKENLELHAEMQKLLQATLKQKDDFNRLYETVRRQKDMLQKLEAMAKTGSLGQPTVAAVIDSREVAPIQCCHDLEMRAHPEDVTVVYLISGRHEFRRKLLRSSDELLDIYIPESVNTGNRMLPGRQSFPNALLQSLTFDNCTNFPTGLTPRTLHTNSLASEFGAVDGAKNALLGSRCPVCDFVFPLNVTHDKFKLHVESHFPGD